MSNETQALVDTFEELLNAFELLSPAPRRDEPIRTLLDRCPQGHPAKEIASRTWKCEACGGLGPLMKMQWAISDEGREPCCPYCSQSQLVMWKPAVAGHA